MNPTPVTSVDFYINDFQEPFRTRLEEVRRIILDTVLEV